MDEPPPAPGWWRGNDGRWHPPKLESGQAPTPPGGWPAGWQSGAPTGPRTGPASWAPPQQGFGAAPPPPFGASPAAPGPSSPLAAWSLGLGLSSMVLFGLFTGIPAIVLGVRARKASAATGAASRSDGLAVAGIVTGGIGSVVTTLVLVVIAFTVLFLGQVADSMDDVNSDPVDSYCDNSRYWQDPDC